MNILLIGSGGREHALAWKIAASTELTKLWCAPGNAGIARDAECIALDVADHEAVIAFCKANKVDLVVVGPEAPLAAGIVDDLAAHDIKAFGPTRAASQLESSKGFTKDLCRAHNIPTAAYERFKDADSAKAYVRAKGAPIVVKADGLAAGKGVVVAATLAEAEAAIDALFASAGAEAVVEEFLQGEEASFFVLCDGEHALPLATAQDHKRAFDGDKGPNTGGMGAYSPAPVMTDAMVARTMDEIIRPTLRAMKERGMPYKGVLFAGLMVTPQGPKLIEYNVRFGDPETQVLMMRLMSDLVPALVAAVDGELAHFDLRWYPQPALTVVMAAQGYPGNYIKGSLISGLDDASRVEGVEIFHAGTRADGTRVLANGGRVLNVTATGKTVGEAQRRAYQAIDQIKWPEGFCRRDIGWQAIKREQG
ncbi:phosphoribosylamine--glycine ligase [Afipia carboxidovorans OM5]|uniref:Phosphoribosylamine--glycine ligase n=1 Tax=Afipia carboxidovorans (strain ATCC 49405 / DSM 1227 / KCTC 32145 / OM5) TaxID=504832 RepID=B6JIV6_AFIC5|nr:phosphoribosylamine--glycine ligase [Afipia carboxidovorans]ACI94350.1 phosphoribosylamine--glycine ligase [Afipia carboxidovorans OM5]AEI02014.1 phosphoribosylamine--glycine ligase PurD [Afipia carboxidovorans OM4]AEI05590.1 phosphoribosylamine--glycine ligase PurD [Afipia carboxidovorans OM5]BEV46357.1 phosphoribosylamine--glycine ligase [Afipia carboxidovorans]